jgi:fructokinase
MPLPCIVGAGEILWDVFPDGARFGGAPANFACHTASLVGQAWVLSAVGADELGDKAIAELERRRVSVECVQRSEGHPTGVVTVSVDDRGQPSYAFGADEAWDRIAWTPAVASLAHKADAICFGTLGQRGEQSRATIRRFVASTRTDCLRVLDLNLRSTFFSPALIEDSLALCAVLKLNDAELAIVAEQLGFFGDEHQQVAAIAGKYRLDCVAVTRGAKGSLLWRQGERHEASAVAAKVVDTVGAGDSFAAALVDGLLRSLPLAEIHERAAQIAAFVCEHAGATPELPDRFRITSVGRLG